MTFPPHLPSPSSKGVDQQDYPSALPVDRNLSVPGSDDAEDLYAIPEKSPGLPQKVPKLIFHHFSLIDTLIRWMG